MIPSVPRALPWATASHHLQNKGTWFHLRNRCFLWLKAVPESESLGVLSRPSPPVPVPASGLLEPTLYLFIYVPEPGSFLLTCSVTLANGFSFLLVPACKKGINETECEDLLLSVSQSTLEQMTSFLLDSTQYPPLRLQSGSVLLCHF